MAHPDTNKKLSANEEPVKQYAIYYQGHKAPIQVNLRESEYKNLRSHITEVHNSRVLGRSAIHYFNTADGDLIVLCFVAHIKPLGE